MSERVQRQAEAERAVRRGELKQALAIYRELAREAPEDPLLPSRIATIESLLQPDEIFAAGPAPAAPDLSRSATLEQAAEALFEQGDLPGALATYQRLLQDRPDNELARERLLELQHLARLTAAPPAPSLPAERPQMLEALLERIAHRRKA